MEFADSEDFVPPQALDLFESYTTFECFDNANLTDDDVFLSQTLDSIEKDKLFSDLCRTVKGVVGWCEGAGLTSSAEASYNLDYSRARACCACSRCGWGWFGHFYSHLSFLSSFSLSLGDGPI